MTMNNQLPKLPEPFSAELFHADQMRAYAELAIASVKWEPLSDEQITELDLPGMMYIDIVRKVEQAHGITATTVSREDKK